MGALTKSRLDFFISRYKELSEMHTMPPFFYGSHFLDYGAVLYYLIRIEPFTTYARELQSGKVDVADRLFTTIADTFENATTSTADVKELVPEFYYNPHVFTNANKYDFGKKQNGTVVDDVILPPWSKGDPYAFTRIMRQVLFFNYWQYTKRYTQFIIEK